jgi:inorganic triphosphatase YgiF
MSEPIEIEAKFDLDAADRDRLLATTTFGRFSVSERRDAMQEDTYFDTADARLAAAGATLRIRRTANDTRMTFKGPRQSGASSAEAHIASRPEDEVSLDAAQTRALTDDDPLPPLLGVSPLNRARELVGAAPFVPVARLRNERTTLTLSGGDSELELTVDDCVGTRLSDGRTVAFNEVELESKSADRATVLEASSALHQAIPSLRPSGSTKLGRTLG